MDKGDPEESDNHNTEQEAIWELLFRYLIWRGTREGIGMLQEN